MYKARTEVKQVPWFLPFLRDFPAPFSFSFIMGLFRSRFALRLLMLLSLTYFTTAYGRDGVSAESYGIKVNTHTHYDPNIGVATLDDTTVSTLPSEDTEII